jgi:ATP-binding cassette, subfamily B, bacterial MsbA
MRQFRRLRPYLSYLWPVRAHLFAAALFGLIYSAATGAGVPAMMNFVFPVVFDPTPLPWVKLTGGDILRIAAYIPMIFLLRGVAGYFNACHIQIAGTRILEAIRLDYFKKLQFLPLSFISGRQTGDLISRGLSDTNQLQFVLTQLANDGIKQPGTLIFAVGYLGYMATKVHGIGLMLVCLAMIPLVVFPIRYFGRKVARRAADLQGQLGTVTAVFTENLTAAREVRAFGLEDHEVKRFGVLTRGLVNFQVKVAKYAQAISPAIEVIAAIGVAATLLFAYRMHISKDDFLGVVTALFLAYEPIKKLGALNTELKRAGASLDRLEVVLHEPVTITDPAEPITVAGRLRGAVSFDRVSFAYKPNEPVLRDISVEIPAGTVCALVGPSGAGKSTFANLVPRFYEASGGRVMVDGHDVRAFRLADLRRNIAVVSQDPVLFNESIYANLLLGRADATRADVEQAARDAHAHDFIVKLPQGYDTVVGERGALVSGGQKQRIALARAFLRNAPILILDEATSALDSESEAAIQAALQKLMIGKTVFIIAHRFSTIRNATKILVFDRGEIVAMGSHGELHASSALYKSLYDRQSTAGLQPAL